MVRESRSWTKQAVVVGTVVGTLLLLTVPGLLAQRGALTVPLTLPQLVGRAETIVVGSIATVRVEPHPQYPNLNTAVFTLRVKEALKGMTNAENFHTYRQYLPDFRDKDRVFLEKGSKVLIMLNKISSLGLTSPAGLTQGRFRIMTVNGQQVAINGHSNYNLFTGITAKLQQKGVTLDARLAQVVATHQEVGGPVELEAFESLISALAGGN